MKIIAFVLSLLAVSILWGCNRQKSNSSSWEPERESQTVSSNPSIQLVNQVVEASCGQCQFSMQGDSCDLAVRIEGVSYFVEGSLIDDHGDAHGDSGLCNCIRKAKVSGEVKMVALLRRRLPYCKMPLKPTKSSIQLDPLLDRG